MSRLEKLIGILLLLASITYGLWLYRVEPTAMVDPNDNSFQYALIDRTNTMWGWASVKCQASSFMHDIPILSFLTRDACIMTHLMDHWVPNWAQGYNLPYYYSHIPQIMIVGSYKLVSSVTCQASRIFPFMTHDTCSLTLFSYYHFIIYLLLAFFPLSVFLGLRVLRLPYLTAGIGALLATQISTDGLYGLDQSSYLWRGWGLSSQLFAAIWLPLALAYSIRFFQEKKENITGDDRRGAPTKGSPCGFSWGETVGRTRNNQRDYILAILFITATTAGHLGIGMMVFLALPVIAIAPLIYMLLKQEHWKTILAALWPCILKTLQLAIPPLILLSYWIIPAMRDSLYHNVSFWDPVWKFNSFGVNEVITKLFNGELFDFGRLPIFTGLIFIGLFASLYVVTRSSILDTRENPHTSDFLSPLPILFLFYLALFFGRTTWGGLFDVIPGMSEFHGHRFIVGVHMIGLFLAPIGIMWLGEKISLYVSRLTSHVSQISPSLRLFTTCIIFLPLFLLMNKQTLSYATYNDTLILRANENFTKVKADTDTLVSKLLDLEKTDPGRVFAGRGGGWGKDFQVAETSMFMYLSSFGIPTVLWLPETWSINSDVEQYFREDKKEDYDLFGIRYVVAPKTLEKNVIQSFWTPIDEGETWILYKISDLRLPTSENRSTGYIIPASAPSVVTSDKLSFANVVRLWIQSETPKNQIFPEIILASRVKRQASTTLPHFSMIDEVTYQTPDNKMHSLFAEPPLYLKPNYTRTVPLKTFDAKSTNAWNETQKPPMKITSQSSVNDMIFKATVEISSPTSDVRPPTSVSCQTCVVILKQTYHPNWQVTVRKISEDRNGELVESMKPISVFPYFTAIRLEEPGVYEVIFSYTPSKEKIILFICSMLATVALCIVYWKYTSHTS